MPKSAKQQKLDQPRDTSEDLVVNFLVSEANVMYWGWSPSNSLWVDDAGRTLLTQTWSNTETFIVNHVWNYRMMIKSGDVSTPDSLKYLT